MRRTASAEYAPDAVLSLFDRVAELAPELELQLGGVIGDQAHVYGYHRARAVLPSTDYSVQLWRDRRGPDWAAAALDITPRDSTSVQLLTHRLARAVERRDRRVRRVVREFYGTLDGANVYGWDVRYNVPSTSDASHLWHLHLSFYRRVVERRALLLQLADVLAGH